MSTFLAVSTQPLHGRALAVWNRINARAGGFEHVTLDKVRPADSILALDANAFAALGCLTPFDKARGYRFESDYGPVIATYDPAEVGAGKLNLLPVCLWDAMTAQKEAGLEKPEFPNMMLMPTHWDFCMFCSDAVQADFLAVDLETEDSGGDEEELEESSWRITRGSMAFPWQDGIAATTFPWEGDFVTLFAQLMGSPVRKVFHNGYDFDLPRLAEAKISVAGTKADTMWLFKALQPTLPRGLGKIAPLYLRCPEWKSKNNSDEELYSAMDAYVTVKCYLGIRKAMMARRLM